jgi:Rod binding domain-containing protein
MIPNVTSMTASAGAGLTASTPQPRLVKAAHEFEAQLMKELLKPMNHSASITGDGDDGDSDEGGVLGEFATEALARGLSSQGGLGIANQIVHSLTPPSNTKTTTSVMGDLRSNTVIKALK